MSPDWIAGFFAGVVAAVPLTWALNRTLVPFFGDLWDVVRGRS